MLPSPRLWGVTMYPMTPESITTRAAIDVALRAEARASRLAAENAALRVQRDANIERIDEWYRAAALLRDKLDALQRTVCWLAWTYRVALTGIGLLKGREAARDAVPR